MELDINDLTARGDSHSDADATGFAPLKTQSFGIAPDFYHGLLTRRCGDGCTFGAPQLYVDAQFGALVDFERHEDKNSTTSRPRGHPT